jgi:sulfur-carrier protein
MPQVKLTAHLKRFFPDSRRSVEIDASTVREVINELSTQFPGLGDYIVDEQGRLRRHVNIFVDGTLVKDRENLADAVSAESQLYIVQALSGG